MLQVYTSNAQTKVTKEKWKMKMENLKRSSGVLIHITSLPNKYTLGTFSCECEKLIDWMSDGGFKVWQVLPITDCGYKYSPYSAISSFAINPTLVDLSEFLSEDELNSFNFDKSNPDRLEEEAKILSALDLIYKKFGKTTNKLAFEKANKYWLDDYALFKVIKEKNKNVSWLHFPVTLKNHDKVALDAFSKKYASDIDKIKFIQFIAHEQWNRIRKYAHEKGVKIFGDIPYYTEFDSADVWSNPKNWKLDSNGKGDVAGVPPDYFNAEGQLWGNPIYNYTSMAKNKYSHLIKRFKHQEELFDILRIDHFIAFSRYWSIPKDSTTAKNGKWVKGAGDAILKELEKKMNISIVAEDLGIVTNEVTALREKYNIPGIKVMQFGFDSDGDNMYQPHNYEKNCVAYIGTHDNDTFMGMLCNSDWDKINRFKRYLRMPLEWGNNAVIDNSIITLYRSSASLIILTMQDILKLDSTSRMNVPGVIEGNWAWQLDSIPNSDICSFYRDLSNLYGRNNN